MPIKEEPVVINFRYEPESEDATDGNQAVYDIQYHTEEGEPVITIELAGGEGITLPASLMIETVDFLRRKGAIPGANMKSIPLPRTQVAQTTSRRTVNANIGLPLPQITKAQMQVDVNNAQANIIQGATIEAEPFTSFAPTVPVENIAPHQTAQIIVGSTTPTAADIIKQSQEIAKAEAQQQPQQSNQPMLDRAAFTRPVLKSRIKDRDLENPKNFEQESAMLRGIGGDGARTIKRLH